MNKADLHIHSNFSDGMLSPESIIDYSLLKGLKAISITDHDNIDAIDIAINYSKDKNIEIIPGIELSTDYNGKEVHILGYFIDYNNESLKNILEKLKTSRINRAKAIIKKLNDIGINLDYNSLCKINSDNFSIGRPHIARALIEAKICNSTKEAFDKYLAKGKIAYVERYKLSTYKAIEIIKQSNGVASLAHPGLIDISLDLKMGFIKKLKDVGLTGIEVYHTNHSSKEIYLYKNVAKKIGLIPTGGSDCHGININSNIIIANATVPYYNVQKLRNIAKR